MRYRRVLAINCDEAQGSEPHAQRKRTRLWKLTCMMVKHISTSATHPR